VGGNPSILQALAASKLKAHPPHRIRAYPNVGALQGEVDVEIPRDASLDGVRKVVCRAMFGCSDCSRTRLFEVSKAAKEICSIEHFWQQVSCDGIVVSDGFPCRRGSPPGSEHASRAAASSPRYDRSLVGASVVRLDARDPEVPSLLRASVPVVLTGTDLAQQAVERWNFDYLERYLADVDNFFVLCAPASSKGRFAYYDLSQDKNPCGYKIAPTNERREMRFPNFRQKVAEARPKKPRQSYYLQNTLLHREETAPGPPLPVGGFGTKCGHEVAKDIQSFRWDWLKQMMGREAQMCQLFCGVEGFSPCHYDPQDNLFAQITGYKRVLLFHPRHFGCLYPWPVHHPQDRQSRVDFDAPDLAAFPRFAELRGQALEAILGPGDVLHLPPGWWHHIEMLPSPADEVVSINFWYPPPTWFHGNLAQGEIDWDRPLYGVRRMLFQRCVEELVAQTADPSKVQQILQLAVQESPSGPVDQSLKQALLQLDVFLRPVFADLHERRKLLREVLEGRFERLA